MQHFATHATTERGANAADSLQDLKMRKAEVEAPMLPMRIYLLVQRTI